MRIIQALLLALVPLEATACSGVGPLREDSARNQVQAPAGAAAPASDTASSRDSAPTATPAPLDAGVQAWIEQGRALLDGGRAAEAEALFARAAEADALRARTWVLRARMDQGRSDEVLAELDALDDAGAEGPDMTYLYGMAFARRAEAAVASGVTDASVQMGFLDAATFLAEALAVDAVRYRDAHLLLALSAWFTQDLDTARRAADAAVAAYPDGAQPWLVRGRVVMSQFVLVENAEAENAQAGGAEAEELWGHATDSFRRALALSGTPQTEAAERAAATAATELAHALLWRRKGAEATEAFARAIAWSPDSMDYAQMQELLAGVASESEAPAGVRAALESGRARFEERHGSDDLRAATLLWWLGWARFTEADWAGAEEAFTACMQRAPEITNAWFYVGLARQYLKDAPGALAAMHAGWEADPATMIAAVQSAGGSLGGFEGLIGWCASQEPALALEAAFLAEMLAQACPEEPRHWNNLGLFLRDEGERMEILAYHQRAPQPDPALLADLYERSFAAYERALALRPDDPQLVNDTALMLHYHLGRDRDRVESMYRRALELLETLLVSPDLSEDDRARFEQTKRDVTGNLQLLLAPPEPAEGPATVTTAASVEPD